jgi:hypothetical protein
MFHTGLAVTTTFRQVIDCWLSISERSAITDCLTTLLRSYEKYCVRSLAPEMERWSRDLTEVRFMIFSCSRRGIHLSQTRPLVYPYAPPLHRGPALVEEHGANRLVVFAGNRGV